MTKLYWVLIALCAFAAPSWSQKSKVTNRGTSVTTNTSRVIKDKPHVFLSFEREGKAAPLYAGESDKRFWFRFRNNSQWQVMICANPTPSVYGEAEVQYEIERYRETDGIPETRSSDTCGYRTVSSGRSILFSIPQEHLAKGLAIRIKYRYVWEVDPDGTDNELEPRHFVYFYSDNVTRK